jgi:DNA-binding NarL/FixJ family response regulator
MIRILIVDDEPSTRAALRMRLGLESDIVVVGEATDGETAVSAADELAPDVVVMDVKMPGLDGIAATAVLHQRYPACAVIVLSLYDTESNRARAREVGAVAFVGKHELDGPLLAAIRRAANIGVE